MKILTRKQKKHARSLATQAINKGIIVKPNICSKCLKNIPLHAHHDDYSKPLEIRWLCVKCHWKWHSKNGYSPVKNVKSNNTVSSYTLSIESRVHYKLKKLAEDSNRTLAGQIRMILEEYLEKQK